MMKSNRSKRCSTPHLFHNGLRGLVADDFVLHSMVQGSIPVSVLLCIFVFILPMYFTDWVRYYIQFLIKNSFFFSCRHSFAPEIFAWGRCPKLTVPADSGQDADSVRTKWSYGYIWYIDLCIDLMQGPWWLLLRLHPAHSRSIHFRISFRTRFKSTQAIKL